jgi:hypothetical protein
MTTRLIAALLLPLLMASACAPRYAASPTSRASQLTPAPISTAVWRQLAARLAPGSAVRLVLTDGTRMRATFLAADDAGVLIKTKTRLPEPERQVAYGAIESLEIDSGGMGAAKAAAIGIGTGAAAFLGLLMVTFALISD